jgi:hypothetical protein
MGGPSAPLALFILLMARPLHFVILSIDFVWNFVLNLLVRSSGCFWVCHWMFWLMEWLFCEDDMFAKLALQKWNENWYFVLFMVDVVVCLASWTVLLRRLLWLQFLTKKDEAQQDRAQTGKWWMVLMIRMRGLSRWNVYSTFACSWQHPAISGSIEATYLTISTLFGCEKLWGLCVQRVLCL